MKIPVILEVPSTARQREFLAAVRRSRELHHPWVNAPATPRAFMHWLARAGEPARRSYFICQRDGGTLVGVATLSEIVRGPLQSAYLSYYRFAPWSGQGFMTAGLRLVLQEAFRTLRLHRVEANIQPDNTSSRALLRRLRFRLEGFSTRYLKINGRWRDHERWALLAEDWRKQ